jgi:lipid II:glycine glycyltransferase (peptidoglycan interpeptide bridge formation enzyme)
MKSKGAYLLQWSMIQWLKRQGVRHYDLGGINPEINPGVYHFKSGLSGVDQSHIGPFVACENSLSAVAVKAGQVLRNGFSGLQQRLVHA